MAVIPLSATNVRLISNVLFTNDYKHTRWFDNVTQQNEFFNGRTTIHTANNVKFIPFEEGGVYKADKNMEQLMNVSYMIITTTERKYYAFVTKLEYVDIRTTAIHFEIDVMQTFRFNFLLKPSYMTREHMDRYNSSGVPNIYRLRENLDYGDYYNTVSVTPVKPFGDTRFLVIACKQPIHDDIEREITPINNGVPQPLTYYIHPFYDTGEYPDVIVSGVNYPVSPLKDILKGIFTSAEGVNNVVSVFVTDYPGCHIARSGNTLSFNSLQVTGCYIASGDTLAQTLYVKSTTNYETVDVNLGDKWSNINKHAESKLLVYPYTVYYLTDLKGQQIEVRPEDITGQNLTIEVWGSMGTQNKVAYSVRNYHHFNAYGSNFEKHEYNEALITKSPNLLPIINDYLSAFLQGNANSLQSQMNSVIFNGAMDGIKNTMAVGTSAATGSAIGVTYGTMGAMQSLGNTALGIQAINAQVKDISNVPPSIQSQGSNTNFDFGHNFTGVYLMKKQIKAEYAAVLSDYFKMYGYKVNRMRIPDVHSRQHFNYIEMADCNITGSMPVEYLNKMKMIFQNGITLWHTNDIGNYNLANGEV